MADLLPSSPDPSAGDGGEPRVIGVDSEDADALLSALQSETARDLLAALYDDPATASDLADELDTSIQNVRYHLDNLDDADLVEVADTVYSEKGREMAVYAPAAKPLVVFAGGEDDAPGLETALARLLGALGVLGLASVAVQRLFGGRNARGGLVDVDLSWRGGGADSAAATTTAENATAGGPNGEVATESESSGREFQTDSAETVADGTATAADGTATVADDAETVADGAGTTVTESAETAAETTRTAPETTIAEEATTAAETAGTVTEEATTTVADAAGGATSGLPPGLLFFAGGAVVLFGLGIAWYLRAR